MMRVTRCALGVIVGFAGACNTSSRVLPPSAAAEQHNTSVQALAEKNVNPSDSHPYVQLSVQDLQRLIDNMHKVRLGDDRQKVEALLGTPWSDDRVTKKENRRFIGRFVTYYVVKQTKSLVNERTDRTVLLEFDINDRLTNVTSSVPGIENRP